MTYGDRQNHVYMTSVGLAPIILYSSNLYHPKDVNLKPTITQPLACNVQICSFMLNNITNTGATPFKKERPLSLPIPLARR